MKKIIQRMHDGLRLAGIDLFQSISLMKGLPIYARDFMVFKKQLKDDNFKIIKFYPIMHEKNAESGMVFGHYFHQDLLVARMIYARNPSKHVDIGSLIAGFVAHAASFREIEVIDIRPQIGRIDNIIFIQMDLTKELPSNMADYCDSISSLHAVEHFGLGRYGDEIDASGHLKGLNNIYKILKKGGKFYFSAPIGEQRVVFNAQRVFSLKYLLNIFMLKYNIDSFSYVDDKGNLFKNALLNNENINTNFNCRYGCGIFEMTKI